MDSNSLVFFITKDGVEERGSITNKDDIHIVEMVEYLKEKNFGRDIGKIDYTSYYDDLSRILLSINDTAIFFNISDRGSYEDVKYRPKYGILIVSDCLSDEVIDNIRSCKDFFCSEFVNVFIGDKDFDKELYDMDDDIDKYLDDMSKRRESNKKRNGRSLKL